MSQVKKTVIKISVAVLLIFSLIVSVLAGGGQNDIFKYEISDTSSVEIASNRHTQPDINAEISNNLSTLSGFEKKCENEYLEIWFKEDIASIRVVDKRSGYVWGSLEGDTHEDLNDSLAAMANSICTVEYYDENGSDDRISLSDSSISSEYQWNENELLCDFYVDDLGLGLSFTMKLKDTDIEFEVVKGSVKESNSALIKSLYFVPFLGCAYEDQKSGYMFVPDGSGALIRYTKSASYVSPFEKKVYGMDYGIDTEAETYNILAQRPNDFAVETPQISYPVFGMVHGADKNAVYAEILSGMDYAVIRACPAGFTTNFNWVTARFDYRQKYVQPTGQEGQGVEGPQPVANSMIPKISYSFLTNEDANYSGMARTYRERLIERGVIKTERVDSEVPMLLNLIGADVKDGFLKMKTTTLTTVNQAKNIISSINKLGVNNLSVVYSGWKKGGINGTKYNSTSIEKNIGSLKDLEELEKLLKENSGRFYLGFNPVTANDKQINPKNYSATTLGKEFEVIVRDNDEALFNESYLIKPITVADHTSSLIQKYKFNFCFENLGTKLYADYSRDKNLARSQTKQVFEKIAKLSKNSAFFKPNDYMWKNTKEYFNIPMVNSQYLYETDTVPFLQMVLKGSIDYYAPYANLGFYNQDSILKMIEFATYPSVLLMAEDNYALHNTGLEDYFSLHYKSWENVIEDMYSQIGSALSKVEGASMTEHKVLSNGVILTVYSNGVKILINYNSENAVTEYGTVNAKSFLVKDR